MGGGPKKENRNFLGKPRRPLSKLRRKKIVCIQTNFLKAGEKSSGMIMQGSNDMTKSERDQRAWANFDLWTCLPASP
jgi:hypothetical protein